MQVIKAVCIALSTYSILPVPQFNWDEGSMRYALCALPAAGVFIGAAMYLWNMLCVRLGLPAALFACVSVALPLLISGGIHMDGFMDTADALASHGTREQKLDILKDPHCGAFAIMHFGIYMLLCFGLYYALYAAAALPALCMGFVLSRALTVLGALTLSSARRGGMLYAFVAPAARRTAIAITGCIAALCAVAMILFSPVQGVLCAALSICTLIWYRGMATRHFGGATGDTSGYFLQLCELILLIGVYTGGLLI